jgi:hypothetical protein
MKITLSQEEQPLIQHRSHPKNEERFCHSPPPQNHVPIAGDRQRRQIRRMPPDSTGVSTVDLQHARQDNLFHDLLDHSGERAREILKTPGSAVRMRQLGSDGLSGIQRLEASPLVQSQLLAVGLRLAGSSSATNDVRDHLQAHFATSSSSLEIEAMRRSIGKFDPGDRALNAEAETIIWQVEQWIKGRGGTGAMERPRWAALYSDLWCDPRIGASAHARRTMLAMVPLLRGRGASASALAKPCGAQR